MNELTDRDIDILESYKSVIIAGETSNVTQREVERCGNLLIVKDTENEKLEILPVPPAHHTKYINTVLAEAQAKRERKALRKKISTQPHVS